MRPWNVSFGSRSVPQRCRGVASQRTMRTVVAAGERARRKRFLNLIQPFGTLFGFVSLSLFCYRGIFSPCAWQKQKAALSGLAQGTCFCWTIPKCLKWTGFGESICPFQARRLSCVPGPWRAPAHQKSFKQTLWLVGTFVLQKMLLPWRWILEGLSTELLAHSLKKNLPKTLLPPQRQTVLGWPFWAAIPGQPRLSSRRIIDRVELPLSGNREAPFVRGDFPQLQALKPEDEGLLHSPSAAPSCCFLLQLVTNIPVFPEKGFPVFEA